MLTINFEGYFQMRMATDPDPSDEPRGLSGYTFALPGEPDLDRVLHFQPDEPGVVQRVYGCPGAIGPEIGVTVRSANQGNVPRPDLIGAQVSFPNAELVERNGVLIREDFFVIDPLRVQIRKGGVLLLDREDILNPDNPGAPLIEAESRQLIRRQPKGFKSNSWEVVRATAQTAKLPNPSDEALIANRIERQKQLKALRETITGEDTTAANMRAALDTRIEQLDILRQWWNLSQCSKPIDRRAAQLALLCYGWEIHLNGPVHANQLGAAGEPNWPLSFWMGGWDGDALCAYVQGELQVPLVDMSTNPA